MIRKILIPVGLGSDKACHLGIHLARAFRAELLFVHCLPPPALSSRFFFPKSPAEKKGGRLPPGAVRRAEERVLALLADLPLGDLHYSLQITEGAVLAEILRCADSARPDWIIQGNRLLSRLEEWIPRGTSWRLIRKASSPVITVKHDPPASHWPLRKILHLTDFGESSLRALPHAAALAHRTGAELIILHVLPDGQRVPDHRDGSAAGPAGRMASLLEKAQALQTGLRVSASLMAGTAEEAVFARIGEGDVGMIVIGTGRGGSGMIGETSFVEWICRRATCPVMTVNREAATSGIERRYRKIYHRLNPADLAQISEEQPEAVAENLFRSSPPFRISELFLKHYSQAGLMRIFEEYGIFALLRRKGFADLDIRLNLDDPYRQRLRVCFAGAEDENHTLLELILREGILEAQRQEDAPARSRYYHVLMVEWLCMQNPTAAFTPECPPLPGQRYPGLGISREVLQLISLIGMRIGKDGIAIHPQYFHAALLYHALFKCYNPVQEGQLAALMRDTEEFNLDDVSWAIDLGCLRGKLLREKASWEADFQVHPLTAPLQNHFESDHYRQLFWESLAGHHYRIDWPQFNQRLRERTDPIGGPT
ncbi:MAG: universal stress protein [Deltaproteobacteria bacterium]|nr:universal stress protein [Deltaproteobacteria bacterium]